MKTYTSIRPIASLFFALVACALTALQTQAEPQSQPSSQSAEVTAIEGKASYVDPKTGETVNVTVGTKVPAGATLQTEAGAKVDLFLGRNTGVVRVNGNTSVKFERLESSRNGSETVTDTVLKVEKGEILANVNKLSKASSYKVELPDSTVKVSEGQFQAAYTPEGTPGQGGQGGSVVNVVSGRGQIVTGSTSRSLKAGRAYSVGNGSSAGKIDVGDIPPGVANAIAEVAQVTPPPTPVAQNGANGAGSTGEGENNNQSNSENQGENQNQNSNQNQNQNNSRNNNNVGPASLPLNNTSGNELSPTVAS